MKTKAEVEEATEKTKKAVQILRETISLNTSVRFEDWVTAFHVLIASAFYQSEASYKYYCQHMEEARKQSKSMWD